jgi:acyl-CoA synthetase (AMP-forming)/AMP-acid ligase II
MKKNLFLIAVLAVVLAGCVVVPARPLYVHAPRVVVY